MTLVFRLCFRQKAEAVYPCRVKFKDVAIEIYVGNCA